MAPELKPPWPPPGCPAWCTREHHAADHPEDRRHHGEAAFVPVIVTQPPTYDVVASEEWLVHGHQGAGDDAIWVSIGSAETSGVSITVSLESAHRLCAGLESRLAELNG
jgi:hypothetical protein